MRGNTFGKLFSITSFGESHGVAIGVVLDGVPANLDFNLAELQAALNKRAPGRLKGVTARKEADEAEILSGIFENKTLGTPICVVIKNTNQRSKDYSELKKEYRAGHADETTMLKYGIRDHRGGGRSSGRETIARVIGGYFAGLLLNDVKVKGYVSSLGIFQHHQNYESISELHLNEYAFPDIEKNDEIEEYLINLKKEGNSVGGKINIIVENCPVGLGEPAFDKLKADFAKALLSIGGCVSFSFGFGELLANLSGKEISQDRNAFGGIEGGISNGKTITLSAVFKPTSTVGDKAKSGRHDPCILPRAVYVVEAMVKIVLADHLLRQKAYL